MFCQNKHTNKHKSSTIKDGAAGGEIRAKTGKPYATFVSEAALPFFFFVKRWAESSEDADAAKLFCLLRVISPSGGQTWQHRDGWIPVGESPTVKHLCTGIKAHKLVLFMKVKWPQDSGKPISTACLLRPYILYIYCRSSWVWLV